MQPIRRCWNCGGSTFHPDIDGEHHCLVCGRQAIPPMTLTEAARLGGVSVRTVKRWADAGLVAASPAMGSGRPRMADGAAVLLLVDRRSNITGYCAWCAGELPSPGVRRGHQLRRRFCCDACKSAEWRSRHENDALVLEDDDPQALVLDDAGADEEEAPDIFLPDIDIEDQRLRARDAPEARERRLSSAPPPKRAAPGAALIVVDGVSSGTTMDPPGV